MTLSLAQALEILAKLQAAAPPTTGGKLAQITGLLKHLADENAYLNTILSEETPDTPSPYYERASNGTPSFEVPEPAAAVSAPPNPSSPTLELVSQLTDALRPPLVAIRGRAELVQGGLLGKITSDQDLWLQAIQENTDRAFSVLDSAQELVALQKGQAHIEAVNFISTDLLTEAWERIRDRAKQYNHEVSIQAPDVVPLARGDFYQTLIVLTDILDNAVRYTPPNGQIRMSVDDLGTHVLFSVADNGIGLRPEDMEQVGRAFWRGDHHRLVRQHAGTGLRLYLAKQILALQGGELIFSGEPGLGSTFSFTLPAPE